MKFFAPAMVAIVLAVQTMAPPTFAHHAPGHCNGDVNLGCSGGGPGEPGAPGGGEVSSPYWTAPLVNGLCDWSEAALLLYTLYMPDGSPALPAEIDLSDYPGAFISNGYVVKTECIVLDLDPGRKAIEDATVSETASSGIPTLSTSPVAAGATGLDTWLWYTGITEIGPVAVDWTEPVTGLVFQLEGRGWLHQVDWDMGDSTTVRSDIAEEWLTSAGIVGSIEDPAATHMYDQTPAAYGLAGDTYPLTTTATWEGEWRYAVGGTWSAWQPFPNTWTTTTTEQYQVVEIRPVLTE